jgi:hypothetical protein
MGSRLIEVGMFYQVLAYIGEYGLADRDFLIVQTRYRLMKTWSTIQPFVEGERRIRDGPNTFFNAYEVFADHAANLDEARATRRLLRRGRKNLT